MPDVLAGSLMAGGEVDAVVVGADRIAANGDVANKVGTYSLAVLAHYHGVPFYVAAPTSTFDARTPTGAAIAIERRVGRRGGRVRRAAVAPEGSAAENRAFDVTPAALVTAYITEDGVTPPFTDAPTTNLVRILLLWQRNLHQVAVVVTEDGVTPRS